MGTSRCPCLINTVLRILIIVCFHGLAPALLYSSWWLLDTMDVRLKGVGLQLQRARLSAGTCWRQLWTEHCHRTCGSGCVQVVLPEWAVVVRLCWQVVFLKLFYALCQATWYDLQHWRSFAKLRLHQLSHLHCGKMLVWSILMSRQWVSNREGGRHREGQQQYNNNHNRSSNNKSSKVNK